jgi:hypothetical protein
VRPHEQRTKRLEELEATDPALVISATETTRLDHERWRARYPGVPEIKTWEEMVADGSWLAEVLATIRARSNP